MLIGPGGVFTVNTKRHPDGRVWVGNNTVRINRRAVPYLHKSRHEAERAARLVSAAADMPVIVRPVLVFLTGTLFPDVTIKQAPSARGESAVLAGLLPRCAEPSCAPRQRAP